MESTDLDVRLIYTDGARMGEKSMVGRVADPPGGRGGLRRRSRRFRLGNILDLGLVDEDVDVDVVALEEDVVVDAEDSEGSLWILTMVS